MNEKVAVVLEQARSILPELLNCGSSWEDIVKADDEPYFTTELHGEGCFTGVRVEVGGEHPGVATFHEDGDAEGISKATAEAFCKAGSTMRDLCRIIREQAAELAALREESREPGRCATCSRWQRWTAEQHVGECSHPKTPMDFDTPEHFGCIYHEPMPTPKGGK
jgi:hypothetical protein